MTLIKAENRELTHSRYQSTKGIPTTSPKTRGTGLLLGTDFRHAVEFSRSGRARTPAFRPSFEAALDVTPCSVSVATPGGSIGWPSGPLGAEKTLHHLARPCRRPSGVVGLPGVTATPARAFPSGSGLDHAGVPAHRPRNFSIPTVRPGCRPISRTASSTPGMKEARS